MAAPLVGAAVPRSGTTTAPTVERPVGEASGAYPDPFSRLAASIVRIFAKENPAYVVALVQEVRVVSFVGTFRGRADCSHIGPYLIAATARLSAGYHHAEEFA